LEFLLERELRHEDRAANQKQPEHQQHVKNFQARQLSQRVAGDSENPRHRENAVTLWNR
jgi:hypothetical protein